MASKSSAIAGSKSRTIPICSAAECDVLTNGNTGTRVLICVPNDLLGLNRLWPYLTNIYYCTRSTLYRVVMGARGSVVVKVPCCKPEGQGLETRRGKWIFFINLNYKGQNLSWVQKLLNKILYQLLRNRRYYYLQFFSIYLILPAALGPGVYSASNRNEY
jgi:hypothetical protein